MKVILFCGGMGLRLREYSELLPKPMVPIGPQPILWHVMRYYCHYGHRDFVLCLGYKASVIKDYFLNYRPTSSCDFIIKGFGGSEVELLGDQSEPWTVALVDTGLQVNIGQRLRAVRAFLEGEELFMANYSDGVTDAPLDQMIDFFRDSGKVACFLAVQPHFSYHLVQMADDGIVKKVSSADESETWINGGFFIFRRAIFDYLRPGEELVVEPFRRLIAEGQLIAFKHHGFWASMDTLKDKQVLEDLFEKGRAPWMPWLKVKAES